MTTERAGKITYIAHNYKLMHSTGRKRQNNKQPLQATNECGMMEILATWMKIRLIFLYFSKSIRYYNEIIFDKFIQIVRCYKTNAKQTRKITLFRNFIAFFHYFENTHKYP